MGAKSAAAAAKRGLASLLSALTAPGGGPLFASVLSRLPFPGEAEQRPRAAVTASVSYSREPALECDDIGGGRSAVRVGEVSGQLRVYVVAEDPIAGDGGAQDSAEEIAAAVESAFEELAAGGVGIADADEGLHGLIATDADYYGARFLYDLDGVEDPPIELMERGIAHVALRFSVVGPVLRVATTPPMDVEGTLEAPDGVIDTIEIDRNF